MNKNKRIRFIALISALIIGISSFPYYGSQVYADDSPVSFSDENTAIAEQGAAEESAVPSGNEGSGEEAVSSEGQGAEGAAASGEEGGALPEEPAEEPVQGNEEGISETPADNAGNAQADTPSEEKASEDKDSEGTANKEETKDQTGNKADSKEAAEKKEKSDDPSKTAADKKEQAATDAAAAAEAVKAAEEAVTSALFANVLTATDGSTYRITVECGPEAGIPEGASLVVSGPSEEAANAYLERMINVLSWSSDDIIFYNYFFNISIMHEGRAIQPASPVKVTITLTNTGSSEAEVRGAAASLKVVQFDDPASPAQPTEVKATESGAVNTDCNISFMTSGFSAFGVAGIMDVVMNFIGESSDVSVYGLREEGAPSFNSISIEGPEEGVDVIEAYNVNTPGSMYADISYSSNEELDDIADVSLYSVDGGELGGVIDGQFAEGETVTVALDDVEGYAVVKDSGLRRRHIEARSSDGGKVAIDGMVPKYAVASADNAKDGSGAYEDALLAYDITIHSQGSEYQPSEEEPVVVAITNKAISETIAEGNDIHIWHIADDGTREEVYDFRLEGSTVIFEATGFSVYEIIDHEGGEVITPRVEFHFIAPVAENDSGENVGGEVYYTASPYEFKNKADNTQTTMIVRNGDTLESIESPANRMGSHFYGWYTVNYDSGTSSIRYSWPNDTKRVDLDKRVTVSAVKDGSGKVTSVTWSVNGTSGTVSGSTLIDSDGCAHVYLAPIYDNYHFVNFHLGARGTTTAGNVMARKLAVYGSSNKTEVLISDIEAPSTDPVHLIFKGWEYYNGSEWVTVETIDDDGNEILQEGKDGTYITIGRETVDLFPVFVEARWIRYNIGDSGNGARYVTPKFAYTSDHMLHPIDSLATTTRTGFRFDGWYTGPDGTGTKIANADGSIVNGPVTYSEGGKVLYRITGGQLYVYAALEDLNLYAKWAPSGDSTYYIYFWQQNANDDEYTFTDYALVENVNAGEMTNITGNTRVTPRIDTDLGTKTVSALYSNSRFTLNTTDHAIENKEINGDGSTVINVYYDRQVIKLRFFFAREYTYNGRTFVQVNNNNEGFNNNRNGTIENALTYVTSNDYQRIGGTNTWKDVYNGTGISGVSDLISSSYLSRAGLSFDPSTDYITASGRTWVFGTANTANPSNSNVQVTFKYYYLEVDAKYGQSLVSLWPAPGGSFNSQKVSNYNYEQRGGNISPVAWGSWADGSNIWSTYSMADTGLLKNNNDEYGYFILYWRFEALRTYLYRVYFSALPGETDTVVYNGNNYVEQTDKTGLVYTGLNQGQDGDIRTVSFDGVSYVARPALATGAGNTGTYDGTDYTGTIRVYYKRNEHSLIFNTNVEATDKIDGEDATIYGPQTASTEVPWGSDIKNYVGRTASAFTVGETTLETGDGTTYIFQGWFDTPAFDGTAIDFTSITDKMPDKDVTYYGKWEKVKYQIQIDPNGGVIDHINYSDMATYFNTVSNELIGRYILERQYLEITDIDAASMEEGSVYRYINTQYSGLEGGPLPASLRNAIYITDTEEAITGYYNYYVSEIQAAGGLTPLPRALWERTYLSTAKYRKLLPGENYVLIGWYEIDEDGNRASAPYDFTTPATKPVKLRAYWRLDGGYRVQYTTEYYAANRDYITADLDEWMDPSDERSYADQADTQAMQEPKAIRVNGELSDEYQFRGWQIVRVKMSNGIPIYTALEPGVYYTAGQHFNIQARYADNDLIIHMQAVYEKTSEAYRRPNIVNLTLDASRDAFNAGTGSVDASKGDWPAWNYSGQSYPDEENGRIVFGDIQSNAAVHLYKYATELTTSAITGAALSPAGVNFFEHSAGYKLIGFDEDAPDTDFTADHAADAVVAVTPGDSRTLYAVWEPLVYLTVKNETGVGPVTFDLGTLDNGALAIVNRIDGTYGRIRMEDLSDITLEDEESVTFAIPYGENKRISLAGTNDLGVGYMLSAESKLGTQERTLTGILSGDDSDFTKVPHNSEFGFFDTLVQDPEGVVITFKAEKAPHTLILEDNYNGDGTGGGTKEVSFSEKSNGTVYYINENTTSYELPSTSTRIGYEFLGWDANPRATTPTYRQSAGWTIANLTSFFGGADIKTLYAIWTVNAERGTVNVWKDVPEPGDRDKEFTFTVGFTGSVSYQQYQKSGFFGGRWNNMTGTMNMSTGNGSMDGSFVLKHGEYLKIVTVKNEYNVSGGGYPYLSVSVQRFNKDGDPVGNATDIRWTWKTKNNGSNAGNTNGNIRSFSFTDLNISVTESDYSPQYDTDEEVAGTTSQSDLAVNRQARRISWTSTDAGGTVIYTNTRRTADVTIKKTLVPATLPAARFEFTAELENGESYELDPDKFNLWSSNANGHKIEGIPTGATLTVTETADDDYVTTAKGETDDKGANIADLMTTDGGNVFKFVVNEDSTITFTNRVKEQKIRLQVVDDEGNPLDSATFTFPEVFTGERYSAEGTGLVWEGNVYVGDYVLTQTWTPNLYSMLTSPVTVTVGGNEVSVPEGTKNVTVEKDENTGTWVITVVNGKKIASPTDVSLEKRAYWYLWLIGIALAAAIFIPWIIKRRREEAEEDD